MCSHTSHCSPGPTLRLWATSFMLIERKSGMSSRIVALLPRKSRSANRVKPTLPICRSCWDAADGLRLTAVATSNDQNSTYRMSSSDECGRRASTHLSAMLLPRSAWMAAAVPVEPVAGTRHRITPCFGERHGEDVDNVRDAGG